MVILILIIYTPILLFTSSDTVELIPEIELTSTELIVIPTPTYTEDSIVDTPEISELKRYDRDNDGILNDFELKVIETDYHHKRLTKAERIRFISIIGYTPVINPIPTPEVISEPIQPSPYLPTQGSSIIPSNYYEGGQSIPNGQTIHEYLSNSEWLIDYEENAFDCSQMAAYMEWYLTNCGYNVVIRCANVENKDSGHAWILIEFSQGWMAYECTERYWVYPSEEVARSYDPYGYVVWNPSMYTAGIQYDSIYDVWDYYRQYRNGEEDFLDEYAWWIK